MLPMYLETTPSWLPSVLVGNSCTFVTRITSPSKPLSDSINDVDSGMGKNKLNCLKLWQLLKDSNWSSNCLHSTWCYPDEGKPRIQMLLGGLKDKGWT